MPVTPDTDLEERKVWLMSWAEDLKTEHAALAETPLTELIREQRCEIAAKQRALGLEISAISAELERRKNRTIKDRFEEIMKIERAAISDGP